MPRRPAGRHPPGLIPRPTPAVIRFLLRWLARFLALAIITVIGVMLLRDHLLREVLLHRFRTLSGLEIRLESVESNLAAPSITLSNLLVVNSPAFGGGPLAHIADLHLELDTEALRYRELRLHHARVHVTEFNVVRNQAGETNILRTVEHARQRASPLDAVVVAPPGLEFTGIGTLQLTVGTVRLIDLANPAHPRVIHVGITNESVANVRSMADLHPLILRVVLRELGSHLGRGLQIQPTP